MVNMFTLGDVADILDGALDTGISIIDTLAKLSDIADEGNINRDKCLEQLQIDHVDSNNNKGSYNNTNSNEENINLQQASNDNNIRQSIAINDTEYSNKHHDNDNKITKATTQLSDTHSAIETIVCESNNTNNNAVGDSGIDKTNAEQVKVIIRRTNKLSDPEQSKNRIKRRGTFVLKESPVKTIEDASAQGIPIIKALGDLCNVADDFLKDYSGQSAEDVSNPTSPKPGTPSTPEEFDFLISSKVTEILSSFKKLDSTVDLLKKRALRDNFAHFKNKEKELHELIPKEYQELLTDFEKQSETNPKDSVSRHTESNEKPPKPANLRIDIPDRPKKVRSRPGTYTLSTALDNIPLTQIEIDIENDMEQTGTGNNIHTSPGLFFKPQISDQMKVLNKNLLSSSKGLPDLQVFPIDVDYEPLADESKNNVDTGFNLSRERPGTYVITKSSSDSDSPKKSPVKDLSIDGIYSGNYLSSEINFHRHERPGTYTKDSGPRLSANDSYLDRNNRTGTYTKNTSLDEINFDRNERPGTYSKEFGSRLSANDLYLDRNNRTGTYTKKTSLDESNFDRNGRPGTYTKESGPRLSAIDSFFDRNNRTGTYTKKTSVDESNFDRNERPGTYTKDSGPRLSTNDSYIDRNNRTGTYTKKTSVDENNFDRTERPGTYTKDSGPRLSANDSYLDRSHISGTFTKKTSLDESNFDRNERSGTSTKNSSNKSDNLDEHSKPYSKSPSRENLFQTQVQYKGFNGRSKQSGMFFNGQSRFGTYPTSPLAIESDSTLLPAEETGKSLFNEEFSDFSITTNTNNSRSSLGIENQIDDVRTDLKETGPSVQANEIDFNRKNRPGTYVLFNDKGSESSATESSKSLENSPTNIKTKLTDDNETSTENSPSKRRSGLREKRSSSVSDDVGVTSPVSDAFLSKSQSMSNILDEISVVEKPDFARLAVSQPNLLAMKGNRKISIGNSTFDKLGLLKKALSASLTKLTQLHEVQREISLSTKTLTGSGSEDDIDKTLTPSKPNVRDISSLSDSSPSWASPTKETSLFSSVFSSTTLENVTSDHDTEDHNYGRTYSHEETLLSVHDIEYGSEENDVSDDVENDFTDEVEDDVVDDAEVDVTDDAEVDVTDDVEVDINDDVSATAVSVTDDATENGGNHMESVSHTETPTVVLREKRGRGSGSNPSTYVLNKGKEQTETRENDTVVEFEIRLDDENDDSSSLNTKQDNVSCSPIRRQGTFTKKTKPFFYSRKENVAEKIVDTQMSPLQRQMNIGNYRKDLSITSRSVTERHYPKQQDKQMDHRHQPPNASPNRSRKSSTGLYAPNKSPVHTNFLRRKSKGFDSPSTHTIKSNKNKAGHPDVPLSSRLAALRMQLEEKRRQFEEEKKSKLKEWNEERAQALQNAFFVSFDEKENKDPAVETDEKSRLGVKIGHSTVTKSLSPREYIRQKQLEKTYSSSSSPSQKPTWFVEYSGDEGGTDNTPKTSTEIGQSDLKQPHQETLSADVSHYTKESPSTVQTNISQQPSLINSYDFKTTAQETIRLSQSITDPSRHPLVPHSTEQEFHGRKPEAEPPFHLPVNEVDERKSVQASYKDEIAVRMHDSILVASNMENSTGEIVDQTNELMDDNVELASNIEISSGEIVNQPNGLIQAHQELSLVTDEKIGSEHQTPLIPVERPVPFPEEKSALIHRNDASIIQQNDVSIIPNITEDLNSLQINEKVNRPSEVATPEVKPDEQVSPVKVATDPSSPSQATTLAFTFGDDMNESPGMTPEQIKKRERFIKNRQKQMEEKKAKREAELEKKRKKEDERLRLEEEGSLKKEDQQVIQRAQSAHQTNRNDRNHGNQFHPSTYQRQRSADAVARTTSPTMFQDRRKPAVTPRRVDSASPNHFAGNSPQIADGGDEKRYAEYTGPAAYQKPSGKSNRKIIQNAIAHCCLSGGVNRDAKDKCLEAIENSESQHFLVLFRDPMKFRGVYEYYPETELVTKIYGVGPKTITSKMTDKFFRYNSGGKAFNALLMKSISIQCDGISIKKELWEKKQPPSASKTNSNIRKKLAR